MNNILKRNQKSDFRYKSNDGEIILYNPSNEQYEELKSILGKIIINNKDNKGLLGSESVRIIFKMLVKDGDFIDEYTDEELANELENGNRKIQLLYREITDLIQEISDDIMYEYYRQIKEINSLLNIINGNNDVQIMKNKINKFLKKNKFKLNMDDIEKLKNKPEELINLISKSIEVKS